MTQIDTERKGDANRSRFSWLKSRRTASRKTVSFGDSSSVRSLPFWSLVSLILILTVWYLVTKAWGFPDDFRSTVEAMKKADGERFSDANLLVECKVSEECDESMYTQVLGPRRFPTPMDTLRGFNTLRTEGFKNISLGAHMGASLWRIVRGMFFGIVVGVPVGFSMGLSSRFRGFFDTPVEALRPVPPLALLPLFALWFGIGDRTAYFLLIFASIWIMVIAARAGVQAVNLSKVRAAYSLGASKRQVLFRVILPNALPDLFTGIRVAIGVSWGTVVAAELLGVSTGLGAMIFQARNFFRLDIMVAGIVIIALIGVLMDMLMRLLESILIPWRGKG